MNENSQKELLQFSQSTLGNRYDQSPKNEAPKFSPIDKDIPKLKEEFKFNFKTL
jgi:hypothetical protein